MLLTGDIRVHWYSKLVKQFILSHKRIYICCSYTFTQIQDTSDEHFKFARYELNKEYFDRPALPPPFIVIPHLVHIFRLMYSKIYKKTFAKKQFCSVLLNNYCNTVLNSNIIN